MKRIDNLLLIAGVIIVLGGVGLVFTNNLVNPTKQAPLPTPKPAKARIAEFTELMKKSDVGVPDIAGVVRLTNGEGEFPGGMVSFVSTVGFTETSSNAFDTFGSFAVNYGGSGSFVYVALFRREGDKLIYESKTTPLGDRIIIKSATASASLTNDYDLTVTYLDRGPFEPMAVTPSISKTAVFQVKDHKFQ